MPVNSSLSSEASPPDRRARRAVVWAVLLSLAVFAGSAWLRGGIGATAYETTDSAGRTMGFNDVFSAEHYGIILRNASLRAAWEQLGEDSPWAPLWHLLLLLAHGVLLWMLRRSGARPIRLFLVVQPVLFFLGLLGLIVVPMSLADLLWFRASTRESFIDIPYIAVMSEGVWLTVCAFAWFRLRKEPAGKPA